MDNYVVRYLPEEREAILGILSRSNDIIINQVEPTSVNITIQLEDSDKAYEHLLEQIDREIRTPEVVKTEVIIIQTNNPTAI